MNNDSKLEAVLFFLGEPVKKKKLVELLNISSDELETAAQKLSLNLTGRGLSLINTDEAFELRTSSDAAALIEKVTKEEYTRDLGKAGAETLATVLYRGPIAKRDIDYIRGVNSAFILRNLMIRGLIERVINKKDARSFIYKPTTELLAHLGVTNSEELPEYQKVQEEIESFSRKEEGESGIKNEYEEKSP